MNAIFEKYLNLLYQMFEYDIHVFSQPWMYYIALLPAIGYLIFFFAKWAVLTTPIWMPITIILNSLRKGFRGDKK
jgi:hypothetical protein